MSTTLTVGPVTVTVHPDLQWADEFSWHPVEQAVERTLTGALVVDTRPRVSGRPITLRPGDDKAAWMARETIEALQAWAATPGQVMTLSLRGVTYSVIWRHHDAPALDAIPVIGYSDVDSADYYRATLKLMVTS